MNASDVSTNKAHTRHAWTRHPWVRTALLACAFTMTSGFVSYTVVRLRATFLLERQVAEQQVAVTQLQRDLAVLERMMIERFGLLEEAVWGDLDPKVRQSLKAATAKTTPAEWSVNRDRELRARIANLEKRLLWVEVRD